MIPTTIPDDLVEPGTQRRVFSAPNGDLTDDTIRPVEALISHDGVTGLPMIKMRLELEADEQQRLTEGKPVWLTMLGGLAPFDVRVET